jgi:hypothetical protein
MHLIQQIFSLFDKDKLSWTIYELEIVNIESDSEKPVRAFLRHCFIDIIFLYLNKWEYKVLNICNILK